MSNPLISFEVASRVKCKASIMIQGLTGTGKTGLALLIAKALTKDWSKVGIIDTENKSANLYTDLRTPDNDVYKGFMIGQLTPDIGFKPTNYLAFREVAKKQGITALIEDSISHAWQYKGGVLDLVAVAKTKSRHYATDKYAAWGDEDVVKEKNELLQLIRDPDMHIITTVRVKEKMEYSTDETGKTTLVSLGEQQIQQADLKYEPDLVLETLKPGSETEYPIARVIKTRYAFLTKDEVYEFTPTLLEQLRTYLEEGTSPEELKEKQQKEYVAAVTELLNSKANLKPIWQVLKKDAGYEGVKIADLPLSVIKQLYIKITE